MRLKKTGIALGLAALGLILMFHFWPDVPLDPAVTRLQAHRAERLPAQDNLFNALTGFGVATGTDPAQEGYRAVTRVNAVLADAGGRSPEALHDAIEAAWITPVLTLADADDLLCSPHESGCIARLAREGPALRAAAEIHDTLLARYRSLAAFPRHAGELTPHLSMPLPELRLVMQTQRLALGLWLADHLDGRAEALPAVLEDLRFARRYLAQADALIGKMVAASMVAEDLYVLAAMMDAGDARLARFPVLAPLSQAELGLDPAIDAEFRFLTQGIGQLDDNPARMLRDLGMPEWLAVVGINPVFKPHRTLNLTYRCFERARGLAGLPPARFREQWPRQDAQPCAYAWHDWVLNVVGTVLLQVAAPDFGRYQTRLHDLNGLLSLVNLKRAIRAAGLNVDALPAYLRGAGARYQDPYGSGPMQWRSGEQVLFFESPASGARYNRLPLDAFAE